jgi:hypothetical protein
MARIAIGKVCDSGARGNKKVIYNEMRVKVQSKKAMYKMVVEEIICKEGGIREDISK